MGSSAPLRSGAAVATLALMVQISCVATVGKTSAVPRLVAGPKEGRSPVRRLENGLRVVVQANHKAPIVAAQVWVDVGSADEPQQLSGISHLLEHMLFKGTGRHGVGDVAREIEEAGGDINAWTSFDQTVYHVVMPRRYLRRGLGVLADCVSSARFDAQELRKELGVVAEEISEGADSPGTTVAHELFATAFRAHPYRRPVIGTLESVRQISKRQLVQFYRRAYRPERMTLVIVGDISEAQALQQARAAFVERAGRGNPLFAPAKRARVRPIKDSVRAVEPRQRAVRVTTRSASSREAYISIGFHIPALVHPDTAPLDLAAIVLGQGEGARLVRRVKDELQVVTDVSAYAYSPRDPGLLVVSATTRPERVIAAFRALVSEIVGLTAHRVAPDELSRAQAIADSDWLYQQETMDGLARRLAFDLTVAHDLAFGREYRQRLREVTPNSLRETVARYLRPSKMSVAVVGPKADRALAAALRRVAEAALKRTPSVASARGRRSGRAAPRRTRLRSGVRLITLSDSSVPLVAVRAVWLGGQRFERAANAGINNLLSSLITRGTRTRSAAEISSQIETMSGSLTGFSGRNSFGLRMEVSARDFDRAFELMSDCVSRPTFESRELEARRQEALDDLHALEDDPSNAVMDLFSSTAYQRHPYRLNPLGTERSLCALTRRQLSGYYRRHFMTDQMVLAVVGDIDGHEVERRCGDLFRAPCGRESVPGIAPPREGRRMAPVVAVRELQKEQAHLVVGYPGTTVRSRDRHALEVLAALMSGQSGRLFLRLRDDLGLAYRLSTFSQEGVDPGFFATYVATSPGNLERTVACVLDEVALLRERRVSASDLGRAKRYLIGSYDASLQRRAALASYLAFDELYGLGYLAYRGYAAAINAVTPGRLRAVANKYLDERQRVMAVVRPPADALATEPGEKCS